MSSKKAVKKTAGKPALSIAKPPTQAADKTAPPAMAPARFEMILTPDDSGLVLKDITGVFVFRFPGNQFAGGADRQVMTLDETTRKAISQFYQEAMASFIKKHGTCSVEEALKLLAEHQQQQAAAAPKVSVQ